MEIWSLKDGDFHIITIADLTTQQLKCTRVHLTSLFIRPTTSIHSAYTSSNSIASTFTKKCSVLNWLFDFGIIFRFCHLVRNKCHFFQQCLLFIFGCEVLPIVNEMVGTHHDLYSTFIGTSTSAIVIATSSIARWGSVGISITAFVWSIPWSEVVAVLTHFRIVYRLLLPAVYTFIVTSFSFPKETRRRRLRYTDPRLSFHIDWLHQIETTTQYSGITIVQLLLGDSFKFSNCMEIIGH